MKFCKKSHGIVEKDPLKDPGGLEIARFVDSKFGNHMLVDSKGHVYQVNTRNPKGTKIYWICRETGRDRKQKDQTLRFKVMRVPGVTFCNPLTLIGMREGIFHPFVLFGSDFVSWNFIKDFQTFWR